MRDGERRASPRHAPAFVVLDEGADQMERMKRVRMLIMHAQNALQRGGEQQAALTALQEAIELMRRIEADMSRFRDRLAPTGKAGTPSERW
jgi:hypothetical protein